MKIYDIHIQILHFFTFPSIGKKLDSIKPAAAYITYKNISLPKLLAFPLK